MYPKLRACSVFIALNRIRLSTNIAFEMEKASQRPSPNPQPLTGDEQAMTAQPFHYQEVAYAADQDSPVLPALNILCDLEKFIIAKTGETTRVALTVTGQNLFSYSEQVPIDTADLTKPKMCFHDTSGAEILNYDLDRSEKTIKSGHVQVGELDKVTLYAIHIGELTGNSSTGLGQISFAPELRAEDPRGLTCCVCFCCPLTWPQPGLYKVLLGSTHVGEVKKTDLGKAEVEFQADLDVRLKAIIVVGSFVLFNCLWST